MAQVYLDGDFRVVDLVRQPVLRDLDVIASGLLPIPAALLCQGQYVAEIMERKVGNFEQKIAGKRGIVGPKTFPLYLISFFNKNLVYKEI